MDGILHTPRGESSAIRSSLVQFRDGRETNAAALMQRMEPLRRRPDAAAAGDRRLINPLHSPATVVVTDVAAVVGTVYTPSYVVGVDGMTLGTVTSPSVFEDVVDRVESRATDILGYDYTMDGAVTYAPALTERRSITPVADFETYLFGQIDEVMKSYVLTIDGQFIGTVQNRETLNRVLEQVRATCMDESTVSAGFASGIYTTHGYTPSDVDQDPAAMLVTLAVDTNGQTTYEVQKGDTFMQTAFNNNISMSELETLNPDVDINRIYVSQLLSVKEEILFLSVKTVDNVTYTQSIEYPVVEVQNDSMYQGESKMLGTDVPGEQIVSADIACLNGVEQERTVPSTQVTRKVVNKVIAVDTRMRPSRLPNDYFIWPAYGCIASYSSYRSIFGSYSCHGDINIATSYGTNVAAANGGTVVFAGRAAGSMWSYGNLVIVDHGNGKQTYYGHCSSVLVSVDDKVYQGRPIAKINSAGRSTGNHCHFKVKINDTSVSPLSYLS